jgi:hypothetical protein
VFSRKAQGRRKHRKEGNQPNVRSGWEQQFWDAHSSKMRMEYEPFFIRYKFTQEGKYLPDFVVKDHYTDTYKVYETKGYFTGKDRVKILRVLASNPTLSFCLVFQRDNYLTKYKKSKYSDWCKKHGIDYCIGLDLSKTVYASNRNRKE